jgi:hypothetical protein
MNEIDFPASRSSSTRSANRTASVKPTTDQKAKPSTPQRAPVDDQSSPLFATFPQLASPAIDQKMLVDIIKKLEVDLFESQMSGETEVVKANQDSIQDLAKTNQKKLADMLKKLDKKKHAGLIGKIFGWIGAALGVVLGVVLAVVSFGTGAVAAGALISMSVALAVTLVILSSTGAMNKITEGLAKPIAKMLENFGVDSKKAKQIAQITAQVVVAVAVIAVQIALAVASGGASAANFASTLANKIASISMKVVNFALAADQLAAAGANQASAVYNYQALNDKSQSESDIAILKKIQALIEEEEDTLKEVLSHLLSVQKNMGQLINSENENRGALADIDASSAAV